ncbi:NUDIX domain-containing protein [Altererythrobacter indicus]|uniref:8-oxo-dGTP diphosphatase n=1 Tax=Altericroceibacterium indicum TaxID=374177 RepID=A0A845A595_9SPHN|nr:(deoxy)nucleoside triphosphate pyrophosphohydrolase [Altericroceibacterium indicum]MXP25482.1 NUDIX domain-containing protein [Altericroceibacterium indicum]
MILKPEGDWLCVVAAAIPHADGRILMQQRPLNKHHGGLWEFPGGKVDAGESPEMALTREIEEELGLLVDSEAMIPAGFARSKSGDSPRSILLLLYFCPQWSGAPEGREGQKWAWVSIQDAEKLRKPPMDKDLLISLSKMGIAKIGNHS